MTAPVRVGELRPSQLLWAFGCGSLVDLPQISVVVMGTNFWDVGTCVPIGEARLLKAVRGALGPQVARLLAPPIRPGSDGRFDPFSHEAQIGVPVSPFPRWLRCSVCQTLAELDSGLFELKSNAFRPDKTHFVHSNCQKTKRPPRAVPARFLVACRGGHLDDFPWRYFVHSGQTSCTGALRFFEQGASLQTENLWVRCESCTASRSMVDAFGEKGQKYLPACRGRHPHLGRPTSSCQETLRPVLLGASNTWFPMTMTVLAIPTKGDELRQLISDKWDLLRSIPSKEVLPFVLDPLVNAGQLPGIQDYSLEDIWKAMEEIRSGGDDGDDADVDLKRPEWDAFTDASPRSTWPDFMIRRVEPPASLSGVIDYVVLAERLREVNALLGFTRVEPPDEGRDGGTPPPRAPLSAAPPTWVPANEVRGEGIFLRFNAGRLKSWLSRPALGEREAALLAGHRAFRAGRKLEPLEANFPGALYALLHSFSHALIRELSLECGYSAASVRERIYASEFGEEPDVAGVLVYTAAPDSDGTLGGLVELGKPEHLGRLITQALMRTRVCSSDPLCAEHVPTRDRTLHGAACHACAFVAETSCEMGNRYLDRALMVPTIGGHELAFFAEG